MGAGNLAHLLLVKDVLCALAVAVRAKPALDLHIGEELRGVLPAESERFDGQWRVPVSFEGTVRPTMVRPDAVFALRDREAPPELAVPIFYLEADRGTMSLVKGNLHQSSIRRKILAYAASHAEGAFRRFGMRAVRVLLVTTGRQRMAGMVALCRDLAIAHGVPARLFLFASADDLLGHPDQLPAPDFFKARWLDGAGEERTIFR